MAKKQPKVVQLPDKLKLALARYYSNRHYCNQESAKRKLQELSLAVGGTGSWTSEPLPVWDKNADVEHIRNVAFGLGIGWSAAAGTFWFDREAGKKHYHSWEVSEFTYLTSGNYQKKKRVIKKV